MKLQELRDMNETELARTIQRLRLELRKTAFRVASHELTKNHLVSQLRHDLARAYSVQQQKAMKTS